MALVRNLVALGLSLPFILHAEQNPALEFNHSGWEYLGDETKVETFDGHTALRMRTGAAVRRDVVFAKGTIEFDMQLTGYRAFSYVRFRVQNDGEFEEFYFRSHKSLLPDAIQYTPVFRSAGQWQLYHGPGATAAAEFPANRWVKVRIVIGDSKAAVFVGPGKEPQLIVPHLAHPSESGYFAFGSFLPQGEPQGVYPTNFANLVLKPGEVPYDFASVEDDPGETPGLITEWSISQSFAPPEGAILALPANMLEDSDWMTATTEPSGLVAFSRYRDKPEGVRRATLLAKVSIRAPTARVQRFNFGYSDEISVFLNGTLLFSGNDTYSFNFPRRQGLVSIDQGSLFLPLTEGDNELVLAITDVFGGWGAMGQFEDAAGLIIRAD
jgi:hypothetical protein